MAPLCQCHKESEQLRNINLQKRVGKFSRKILYDWLQKVPTWRDFL